MDLPMRALGIAIPRRDRGNSSSANAIHTPTPYGRESSTTSSFFRPLASSLPTLSWDLNDFIRRGIRDNARENSLPTRSQSIVSRSLVASVSHTMQGLRRASSSSIGDFSASSDITLKLPSVVGGGEGLLSAQEPSSEEEGQETEENEQQNDEDCSSCCEMNDCDDSNFPSLSKPKQMSTATGGMKDLVDDLFEEVDDRQEVAVLTQVQVARKARFASRHLEEKDLSKIPSLTYKEYRETSKEFVEFCSICLECFEGSEEVRLLHCQHVYHKGCIDRWLLGTSSYIEAHTNNCPVCKSTLKKLGMLEEATLDLISQILEEDESDHSDQDQDQEDEEGGEGDSGRGLGRSTDRASQDQAHRWLSRRLHRPSNALGVIGNDEGLLSGDEGDISDSESVGEPSADGLELLMMMLAAVQGDQDQVD